MRVRLKAARSSVATRAGGGDGAGATYSNSIVTSRVTDVNTQSPATSAGDVSINEVSQPGGPVRNSTIKVSNGLAGKQRRYKLQAAAAELLPEERVAWCSQRLRQGAKHVSVCTHQGGAHFSGLAVCGSVWSCPVCGQRIASKRREELSRVLQHWQGSTFMATITLQHDRDDSLAELLEALKDSWRRLKTGGWWQDIRAAYELRAYVTATEVTYGGFGWHVHLHVLMFTSLQEHNFNRVDFKNTLYRRYEALLEQHGHYASSEFGLHVRTGDRYAADYVGKMDYELTHAVTKSARAGGLSPYQLLEKYSEGAAWAGRLFVEYVRCFSGRKQLTYSHGARQVLGMDAELTDEELAAEEQDLESEVVLQLTLQQYKRVYRMGKRAELLEVAAAGDAWRCWQWLQDELSIIPELWQAECFILEDG